MDATDDSTAITNVLTGRPARGIATRLVRERGPIARDAPAFPLAAQPLAALRAHAEAAGSSAFSQMWAGQAVRLARALPAFELTQLLVREAS